MAGAAVRVDPAVAEAWDEYRQATRGTSPRRYVEVEAWAWARLQAKLKRLREKAA